MKSLVATLLVIGTILSCTSTETGTATSYGKSLVYVLKNEESPQGEMIFKQLDIPHEFSVRAGVFSFRASIIDKSINASTNLDLQGVSSKKLSSYDEVLGVFEVRAQNPIKLSPRPKATETLSLTFGLAELLGKRGWYGLSPSSYAIDRALKKINTKSGKIWIIAGAFDPSGFFTFTLGVSSD